MSWGMRVLVWGLIVIVLVIVSHALPQSEREMRLFLALCLVVWMVGTFLWVCRAIFRFVMR